MNVKRFTGRTSRDALNLVRQSFGDDAVVLSTRPCAEGVEVLAMAPDGMQQKFDRCQKQRHDQHLHMEVLEEGIALILYVRICSIHFLRGSFKGRNIL